MFAQSAGAVLVGSNAAAAAARTAARPKIVDLIT
jgi:hypothetical protein